MGIMAGRIGIIRYKTPGGDASRIAILEKLQQFAFREIDEESVVEESIGWVTILDKDKAIVPHGGDTASLENDLEWNGFQFFSLRRDIRRVPGVVLRDEIRKTLDAWLKDHPTFSRVPKQTRADISDAVKLKLLTKTLAVPTVWDIAWNSESGDLFFFNTSLKAMDIFETMFRKTFQVSLRFVTSIEQAFAAAPAFDMANFNKAGSTAVLDLIKSNQWVGALLCSWVLSAAATSKIAISRCSEEMVVYTDRKIIFVGASDSGTQKINISGPQEKVQAAKAALREGNTITEIGITFETLQDGEQVDWCFSLDANTFAIKSLKTPRVLVENDERDDATASAVAAVICKMGMVLDFYKHFNALLQMYLTKLINEREAFNETLLAFSTDDHE